MEFTNLLSRLQSLLGPERVLSDPVSLRVYECDGLTAYRRLPKAVVLPDDIAQVQAILRLATECNIPVVARGAGTGLSGGAMPHADGLVLSLARFNRILSVDADNRTARVQPGVRNLAISEAVAALGLYYAPDPSSQIACSIGGNVAENSGGVHCLKYGLTVHNVLGLKFVTMAGELGELGGAALDEPGLDLLALMHGSEGMLGVIVEVTVRLLPTPSVVRVLLADFTTVAAAANAVADVIGAGIVPAGLEMMDALAIQAAEDFVQAGYPRDAGAILLCELDGMDEEVEHDAARVTAILRAAGARFVRTAIDAAERMKLWKGRKSAFPAVGRLAPDYYCMDGTIPRRQLSQVLRQIADLSAEYGLRVANVFHAGDGNLHPLILYDANQAGQLAQVEEMGARILLACVAAGGTITGEHGVGVEKIDQMCVQFTAAELAQMHRVKAAFDPLALLNPGKAVPSLHRCAEMGAMHVHQGRVAHPELPRF